MGKGVVWTPFFQYVRLDCGDISKHGDLKESPPNLTSCQYMKKHGKGKIRGTAKVFGRTKHINTAKSMIYCQTDEAADQRIDWG